MSAKLGPLRVSFQFDPVSVCVMFLNLRWSFRVFSFIEISVKMLVGSAEACTYALMLPRGLGFFSLGVSILEYL